MPILETGTVVKCKKNTAYVRLIKKSECGACKACAFGRKNELILPAVCDTVFDAGTVVTVQMPEKPIRGAAYILYLLPLATLFAGLLGGYSIGGTLWTVTLGTVGLLTGFFAVYAIERAYRRNKAYRPLVLGPAEEKNRKENEHD